MTFKPGIKKGSKNYQIIKYMQENPTIHPEGHYFENVGWFGVVVLGIPKIEWSSKNLSKLKKLGYTDSYQKSGGYNGVEHCYFLTDKGKNLLFID